MSNYKSVFQRHEIKYMVTAQQRQQIESAIAEHMNPDPHGESTVCNVYYDTPDFRLIRHSLEKPTYKEKLRIRSYGIAKPEDTVFLELKKKLGQEVFKRRIFLPLTTAEDFLAGEIPIPQDTQICREINYCLGFYGNIRPSMYISYDRKAYFGKDDRELRLTLDSNILWRETKLSLECPPAGQSLLDSKLSLLEIKTPNSVPIWLAEILAENRLFKTCFSKYGSAYLSAFKQNNLRGAHCA